MFDCPHDGGEERAIGRWRRGEGGDVAQSRGTSGIEVHEKIAALCFVACKRGLARIHFFGD